MADYRYDWPGSLTEEQQEQVYVASSAFHNDEECDCVPILSDCMDQAIGRLLRAQNDQSRPSAPSAARGGSEPSSPLDGAE